MPGDASILCRGHRLASWRLCLQMLLLLMAMVAADGASPAEVSALREVQAALKDTHGGKLSWVLCSDPCASWRGVVCSNGSKEVVGLDLSNAGLSGSISPAIAALSSLQSLDLSSNRLTGSLPPELGNLTQLTTLKLEGNGFSGAIPPELANLTHLKTLKMSENSLSGPIPPALLNISSLVEVDLCSNGLTGELPPVVGSLPELQNLAVFGNALTGSLPLSFRSSAISLLLAFDNPELGGSIPGGLCRGNTLTMLALFNTSVAGAIPPDLATCTSLQRFRVATGSILTGGIPSFCLQPQPELNYVELSGNKLSGHVPPSFGSCPGLETLKLDGNLLVGPVPGELGNASMLTVLNLSGNQLTGSIPPQLGALSSLSSLVLSGNNLSGPVPKELFTGLSSLQTLQLSDNQLQGELPASISGLKVVQDLDLAENRFSGSIPAELGSLVTLMYGLNLSHNAFNGSIPASLGGLSKLQSLDLSYNNLSGRIPASLGSLLALSFLNLSYNPGLSGPIPDSPTFSKFSRSSFLGNPGLCGSVLSDCGNDSSSSNTSKGKGKGKLTGTGVLVGVIFAVAGICVGVLLAARVRIGKWSRPAKVSLLPDVYGKFTFQEIMVATNNLSHRNLIGQGGYGQVYKGLLNSGQEIAVKKMSVREEDPHLFQSYMTEIETAGQVRHRNIVKLIGYCKHKHTALILYEYHPFGSLGDVLYKGKGNGMDLDWELRYKIALGTAQAISHLHSDCVPQVLHRDIKCNNILLDQDFVPRVTDFGVAKLVSCVGSGGRIETMSAITGSVGYIAPEYAYTLNVGEKSDVYSYGVVLLELLTGKRPVDPSFQEGMDLVHWVRHNLKNSDTIDVVLEDGLRTAMQSLGPEAQEIASTLSVAIICTRDTPSDRPTMKEVEKILFRLKNCSNPNLMARSPLNQLVCSNLAADPVDSATTLQQSV